MIKVALIIRDDKYVICGLHQVAAALVGNASLIDLYDVDADDADDARVAAEVQLAQRLATNRLTDAMRSFQHYAGASLLSRAPELRSAIDNALAMSNASCY